MKKIFCQCYQNYLRPLWFIFQNSGRWFPWDTKGRVPPFINPEVFFRHIGHGKWVNHLNLKLSIYNDLDTLETLKKFWVVPDILDVFIMSSMSDFYIILQFFASSLLTELWRNKSSEITSKFKKEGKRKEKKSISPSQHKYI